MISTVKVGKQVYRVRRWNSVPNEEDGQKLVGKVNHFYGTIDVEDGITDTSAIAVLWHEIIHAIAEQSGQSPSEGLIDALAYGITALIADNPELVKETAEVLA